MSPIALRNLIAIVLFVNGIAHLMGIIPALGLIKASESKSAALRRWSSRSWLLTDLLGDTVARVICVVLFAAVLICSIGAALGLIGWGVPHISWRTLAIISAVISLISVALYWNAFIMFFPHKVAAIGLDIATVALLLIANWPSEAAIGF
jgi:hypothetical protein